MRTATAIMLNLESQLISNLRISGAMGRTIIHSWSLRHKSVSKSNHFKITRSKISYLSTDQRSNGLLTEQCGTFFRLKSLFFHDQLKKVRFALLLWITTGKMANQSTVMLKRHFKKLLMPITQAVFLNWWIIDRARLANSDSTSWRLKSGPISCSICNKDGTSTRASALTSHWATWKSLILKVCTGWSHGKWTCTSRRWVR